MVQIPPVKETEGEGRDSSITVFSCKRKGNDYGEQIVCPKQPFRKREEGGTLQTRIPCETGGKGGGTSLGDRTGKRKEERKKCTYLNREKGREKIETIPCDYGPEKRGKEVCFPGFVTETPVPSCY